MLGNITPKVFMFAGTSSVGKTTTLQQLDPDQYETVILSARVARAALGNPSWQDVMHDASLAETQQDAVFTNFVEQLTDHLAEFIQQYNARTRRKHLVFDRCLWDVCAYSVAFNCSPASISRLLTAAQAFERKLIDAGVIARLVYFEINPDLPYELIDARPPEIIRDRQAAALDGYLRMPLTRLLQLRRQHGQVSLEQFITTLT